VKRPSVDLCFVIHMLFGIIIGFNNSALSVFLICVGRWRFSDNRFTMLADVIEIVLYPYCAVCTYALCSLSNRTNSQTLAAI